MNPLTEKQVVPRKKNTKTSFVKTQHSNAHWGPIWKTPRQRTDSAEYDSNDLHPTMKAYGTLNRKIICAEGIIHPSSQLIISSTH